MKCTIVMLKLQWVIGERDNHCGIICMRTQSKPVCGSDGRSYDTACELQKAHCRDRTLTQAHRGRCRGENINSAIKQASESIWNDRPYD